MALRRQHHSLPPMLDGADEDVPHPAFVAGDRLDEEHAVRQRRLLEGTGGHAGNVVPVVHALPVFGALRQGPRGEQQREDRNAHDEGERKSHHGIDPGGERQAAGKPHHHLGIPIGPGQRQQDRHEQRQRKHDGQVVDRPEAEQGDHRLRGQLAPCRLPEQTDQLRREQDREERDEDCHGVLGQLALGRTLEDHF